MMFLYTIGFSTVLLSPFVTWPGNLIQKRIYLIIMVIRTQNILNINDYDNISLRI